MVYYILIYINKIVNHTHVGFLPLYKLHGKKPNLTFPKQFKHKYKLFKSCFQQIFLCKG